jgi:methyltransferase family protein
VFRRLRRLPAGGAEPAPEPAPAPAEEQLPPGYAITLDYPVRPDPRYGYSVPPHEELHALFEAGRERYLELLGSFLGFRDALARFPAEGEETLAFWQNEYFTGLDVVALYALLALRRPAHYLEVGSGHSTAFARAAISSCALETVVTSIDPQPRAEIDRLADVNLRRGLEDLDLALFADLGPGDLLLFDGSHRCFTNSDATVFFLEVLPRLSPGVLVGIHDIFLPLDYPPEWSDRYYSEQYLLAVSLVAETRRFEVVLPSAFVSRDPELRAVLEPLWSDLPETVDRSGTAFWLQIS